MDTWDAFARLVERHNGVFGGCWCTWFHTVRAEKTFTAEATTRSRSSWCEGGSAHAALVFDGDEAVAWAQYGALDAAEVANANTRCSFLGWVSVRE